MFHLSQGLVSVGCITKFLDLDELDEDYVERDPESRGNWIKFDFIKFGMT